MSTLLQTLAQNLDAVRERMAAACTVAGRSVDSVQLIAVTKYASVEETAALVRLGVADLGESRVQDAEKKIADPSEN